MRLNSMCRFEISTSVPRGFYRIRLIVISITLLTLTCDTQGNSRPEIRSTNQARRSRVYRSNSEGARDRNLVSKNEVILVGRSGDPWSLQDETGNGSIKRARGYDVSGKSRRSRRSVVHLYNMVVCATGCNPMSYKGYGCYCGFLGSGSAVDGIDQCCKMHDRCYDATECPTFLEYFVPYYWKCYRGYRPICAVEHGKWGGSGSCPQRLCECDKALSECLRRFPCPTSKAVCTTSPWRLIQNVFMIF